MTWRICGFNTTVLHATQLLQIWLYWKTFLVRVISRRGDINWPPKSCDLTPLDVFWARTKDRAYADKLLTLEQLKTRQAMT